MPPSWTECVLGDLIDYGSTRKAEPEEIPLDGWVLELEDIEKDTSRLLQRATFRERQSKSTKNRFDAGDVLYGKLRPYLNKVILAEESGHCTTEIVPLKPPAELDGAYLFHWLKHPRFLEYVTSASHGLSMPRLGTDAGKTAPFVLAPLPEQKRVANKLDDLFSHLDACRAHLEQLPTVLRNFRDSVLAAAASGVLSAKWREEHSEIADGDEVVQRDRAAKRELMNFDRSLAKKKSTTESQIDSAYLFEIPKAWAFTTWGAMSEWITYGFTKPMPHVAVGVPLITAKDVHAFKLRLEGSEMTSAAAFAALSDKDRPRLGDLLLTKDGTIGRAALVDTELPFCINQSVAVCWLRSTGMDKNYLEIAANAPFTQQFIRDKAKGMAIQHLSITDFAQCPLPVPPLEEQREIVRQVQSLFAQLNALESRYASVCRIIDQLTPAIRIRAFRGELLPQNPTDEPATELLYRIRAAKGDQPT